LMGLLGAVVVLGFVVAIGLGGLFWLLAELIRRAAAS
jgi:hypothetical protein